MSYYTEYIILTIFNGLLLVGIEKEGDSDTDYNMDKLRTVC